MADSVAIPTETQRIEGRGKFLIPGLADMHVHLNVSEPDHAKTGLNPTRPSKTNRGCQGVVFPQAFHVGCVNRSLARPPSTIADVQLTMEPAN